MAKCKDCLHYDVCWNEIERRNGKLTVDAEFCGHFENKNQFIKLPCKIGDIVYFVYRNKIFEHKIREIVIGEYGGFAYSSDCFPFSAFGNYLFLTLEEAEKALKEG